MSSVGCIADETHRAHEVDEAAIAKVRSMHLEVQSKVALLMARTDAKAVHAVEILLGRVQEVAEYLEAWTSHVAEAVT